MGDMPGRSASQREFNLKPADEISSALPCEEISSRWCKWQARSALLGCHVEILLQGHDIRARQLIRLVTEKRTMVSRRDDSSVLKQQRRMRLRFVNEMHGILIPAVPRGAVANSIIVGRVDSDCDTLPVFTSDF